MKLFSIFMLLTGVVAQQRPQPQQPQGPDPEPDPRFPFSMVAPLKPNGQKNAEFYYSDSDYGDQSQQLGNSGNEPGWGNGNEFVSPNEYENSRRMPVLQKTNDGSTTAKTALSTASAGTGVFFVILILLIVVGCILCYIFPCDCNTITKQLNAQIQKRHGYRNLSQKQDIEAPMTKSPEHHKKHDHHGCRHENISIKLRPVPECQIEDITVDEVSCSECSVNQGISGKKSNENWKRKSRMKGRASQKRSKRLNQEVRNNYAQQSRKGKIRPVQFQVYNDPEESENVLFQKSPRGKTIQDLTRSRNFSNNPIPEDETINEHKRQQYQHFQDEKNRIQITRNKDNESSESSSPRNNEQNFNDPDVGQVLMEEKMVKW